MIDKDGSFQYSRIIVLNSKLKGKVTVYPNPATSSITVTHDQVKGNGTIEIVGIDGRRISSQQLELNATQTVIDVTKLTSGSYLIVLTNGNEKSNIKFVKQ
jgi:hypothetical protein